MDDAATHLVELKEWMKKNGANIIPSVLGVICGMESSAYRRDDSMCRADNSPQESTIENRT